ncbi:glycosyltransferase family 2 protein [Aquiflexum gelatinilyticum]|uniref:glycosyltransferase family 2 protein n=1 Tax=Aquiflexum gelatinilyticum TaxID=2961943 RepID=UPI00216AA68E|nr:glycosyltransferase family 2 protein [Aquiflexum gelatinilyticum]MCS4434558.1 glycosyltransferase family 2 protein [Aquiflexum gelatinilyticum]
MKSVSVIIPVFNSQNTIERAVNSVINQPLVSEIILVDDGSTDNSILIAKNLITNHGLVKLFFHPSNQNRGAAASRNLGLTHAQSEWVQFLDADDELLEGKIEGQIAVSNNEMSFIAGNAIDCFEDGHQHLRKFFHDPWSGLIAGKLGITSANLWNKKFLDKVGGWQESLSSSQEYDLMFRLLKENGKMGLCSQALTKIHKTGHSISNNPATQADRIDNWLKLRKEIKTYLINMDMYSLSRNYVYSGYVFDFCKRNNCLSQYDGSRFFAKLFGLEKTLKKKLSQIFV